MLLLSVILIYAVYSKNTAEPFLSNIFGDNMVIQRAPENVTFFGWHKPGEIVSVKVSNGIVLSTKTQLDSEWRITFPPLNPGDPLTFTFFSNTEKAILSNVLVGDVFICSGQSNMQQTMTQIFNASSEIADANNYPNIRIFTVGQGTISQTPLLTLKTITQKWTISSAKSVAGPDWHYMSAVCWLTGKYIYQRYGVPIGLISNNWGGTYVEAWSSPDALSKCRKKSNDINEARKVFSSNEYSSYSDDNPNQPSVLWNSMINPYLGLSLKGVLWYQGESNSGNPEAYKCSFPAMIQDWRSKFWGTADKNFGFYYVQLAPWKSNSPTAQFLTRLAQDYALRLPNVGVAIAHDTGDPTAPTGDIHPRDKQTVAKRLALAIRKISFGDNIYYRGPFYKDEYTTSNGSHITVTIQFASDTTGSGLTLVPKTCTIPEFPEQCAELEICTGGVWQEAKLSVRGINIDAEVKSHGNHCGTRYGHANYPLASIYTNEGLPAHPFISNRKN